MGTVYEEFCTILSHVDLCNHHYNQDTEVFYYHKVLHYAVLLRITPSPLRLHTFSLSPGNH